MRPITIGISSYSKKVSTNFSPGQSVILVPTDYLVLFQDKNVIPLVLSPNISLDHVDDVCEKIDGLFLIGGEDIDPAFYHEEGRVQYLEHLSSIGTHYQRPFLLKPILYGMPLNWRCTRAQKNDIFPSLAIAEGCKSSTLPKAVPYFKKFPLPH